MRDVLAFWGDGGQCSEDVSYLIHPHTSHRGKK
jgi:hypothetical protein